MPDKKLQGKTEVVKKKVDPPVKATKQEIVKKAGGAGNDTTSRLKAPVAYVQKGVTNPKGQSGSYIYYKDPRKGGINPETDREFVSKSGAMTAAGTNEMKNYNKNKKKS